MHCRQAPASHWCTNKVPKSFCSRCIVVWDWIPRDSFAQLQHRTWKSTLKLPVLFTSCQHLMRPSALRMSERTEDRFNFWLWVWRVERKKKLSDAWRCVDARAAPIQATESCINWTLTLLGVLIKLQRWAGSVEGDSCSLVSLASILDIQLIRCVSGTAILCDISLNVYISVVGKDFTGWKRQKQVMISLLMEK